MNMVQREAKDGFQLFQSFALAPFPRLCVGAPTRGSMGCYAQCLHPNGRHDTRVVSQLGLVVQCLFVFIRETIRSNDSARAW
jgi:hypothetical protein